MDNKEKPDTMRVTKKIPTCRCSQCVDEDEPCKYCLTGEPEGAGEDCFERSMRARYPLLNES